MHTDIAQEEFILDLERILIQSLMKCIEFDTYTFIVNAYKVEDEKILHISMVLSRNENISKRT